MKLSADTAFLQRENEQLRAALIDERQRKEERKLLKAQELDARRRARAQAKLDRESRKLKQLPTG
ncbi:hypothetical protein KJE20_14092 [Pyrenophora tritici-repentis]|nr:hypothetical protein KJE20_14092 [Pyrenophora tritici-repentis]